MTLKIIVIQGHQYICEEASLYIRYKWFKTLPFHINCRNPNEPTVLEATWPQYTADRGEYFGLSPNLTVRSKMRLEKMALWNELRPSIQETTKPTALTTSSYMSTSTPDINSSTSKQEDKKGIATKPKKLNTPKACY